MMFQNVSSNVMCLACCFPPHNICISSPLLITKLPPNLAASNGSLLYHSFCRSGVQNGSASPLAQSLSQGRGHLETWLREDLPSSLSGYCQASVPLWLLAQGTTYFLAIGPLCGAAHNMAAGFPPRQGRERRKREIEREQDRGTRNGESKVKVLYMV